MKIFVSVKLNRSKECVEELDNGEFIIWTKLPAKENKANLDVIDQIAKFFNIPKSQIILKLGAKSKKKVFEITSG